LCTSSSTIPYKIFKQRAERGKPNSKGQMSHVLSHLWKLDLNDDDGGSGGGDDDDRT
jgi:hypothetical protein